MCGRGVRAPHEGLLPVAMPPKLIRERIQEKLAELRAYVTDHVDVLRIRPESTVLEKLRERASKEERAWIEFCTYDLINEASARILPGHAHERGGIWVRQTQGSRKRWVLFDSAVSSSAVDADVHSAGKEQAALPFSEVVTRAAGGGTAALRGLSQPSAHLHPRRYWRPQNRIAPISCDCPVFA